MNIWHNEQDWPKDFGDYIFLARAVRIVGQARFPTEWTDQDPTMKLVEISEPRENAAPYKSRHPIDPTRRPPPVPHLAERRRRAEAAAQAVAEAASKQNQVSNAALARVAEVRAVLTQWFSENSVRTYTRKHSGGNFTSLDEYSWNGENIEFRFSLGKINTVDPYERIESYKDKALSWVFVNLSDINRKLGIRDAKIDNEAFIPEILLFALEFSKSHEKYIGNPRLDKGSLKTLIAENWPNRFGHVKNGTVDAIATILRPIQAQLGSSNPDRMARPKS